MSSPTSRKPKYEVITDDILARIYNNDFSYDAVFCTEKQLAEQYSVSQITAKRAITDLEQRGVLYRKRGVGSFVSRDALTALAAPVRPYNDSKMVSFLLPVDSTKGNLFQTIEVVTKKLSANGYFLSLYISDLSSSKEKANIRLLMSQHISGLVYYPTRDMISLNLLNEFVYAHIPVIIVDKSTDCPYLHNIVSDNFEGGRLLTEHLIGLGHRNIVFFTISPIDEVSSIRNRFSGYLYQMQSSGIAMSSNHMFYHPHEITESDMQPDDPNSFQHVIRQLYNSGVTAIIAENDQVARFIHMACNEIGLRIPEDISICGFDNTEIAQELNITTIKQDFVTIGEQISQVLLTSMANPTGKAQRITVPVELVVRSSTGVPRVQSSL
ncbi:MAG: GntR family transcriptional regulator [Lachnospiraceae bacterium]|nr:GntR family transcriptional regulator [Lachnospiraceae bacterium]